MNRKLNVGVVGCGYWGPNLIRNFRSLSGCWLKVMCDTDPKRLSHLKSLYPEVETMTGFDGMLNGAGLDAVAIATPVHLHHALAKASLLAGKHVFVEKPMASSSRECDELIDLARERGLTFMVGHTFIYSPPVRKIKEIVDSGDIGEVRYISSRRLNLGLFQKDINVTWDLAPHDLAIIMYVMGEVPCTVNCQGNANVTPGIEDVTNMTLQFPGGGFAMVHNSWLDPRKIRDMTIVGSRRMIVYDDLEPLQKIKIFDMRVERPPHYDTFAEFQYSYHYGDMYAPYIKQEEPLKVQCQHFLDCIQSGQTPITSGERGRDLVRILEAASESLKQGGAEVRIDLAPRVAAGAEARSVA
jgi:predicted dehydrogenase